jgi:hypothetical protein
MDRARRTQPRLVLPALFLAVAGCTKAKPHETPAPVPDTEGGAAPAIAAKVLLCSDGFHRRGDHWKVACNVCRCGADGDILCSSFPCAEVGPRDASARD